MIVTKQQMVEMIKQTGEYIAAHAEEIVGDYEGLSSVSIYSSFDVDMNSLPTLDIDRDVTPKATFNYVASEKWVLDGRGEK